MSTLRRSIKRRVAAFTRRHRGSRWYVFTQIYLLAGLLSAVYFFAIGLWCCATLMASFGPFNILIAILMIVSPIHPSPTVVLASLCLATFLVFLRYWWVDESLEAPS